MLKHSKKYQKIKWLNLYSYLHRLRLPKSDYDYVEKPDFELYGQGFNIADPKSELYLHIPVQRKSI